MAQVIARPHVPEEELHAFCDGELSPAQRVEIAEHLMGCLLCRAQHAEVEAVRARASSLLAVAVPQNVRRISLPPAVVTRRRLPRMATAVAAALVGVGVWFSLKPEAEYLGGSQLASSLSVSNLFGRNANSVDSAGMRDRALEMFARTGATPRLATGSGSGALSMMPVIGATDVDPVLTTDWQPTNLDSALRVGGGSLAHLTGVTVAAVRIHPNAIGGRPTFMVRQQLQDGRPIWIFEGLEDDIEPVNQVLQASGIAMSMVTRTKPDYVGTGADQRVTTRMVTVVGYLPVDSLNALVSKLTYR